MNKILPLLLLLLAAPLRADEPVRFFVERVDVRNLRHAGREVILTEARLHEGSSYSEAELRDANDRIERLPFVLDAQFALEKGSRRDAFVLAITIEEARPFFYGVDFTLFHSNDDPAIVVPSDERLSSVGFRFFTGRSGMFHIALGEREYISSHDSRTGTIGAGYTQYGLFGRDAFATVNLSIAVNGSSNRSLLPELVVGIPLTPTQTLTVSAASSVVQFPSANEYRRRALRVEWSHNTTNHPFFPTRGTLLSAGPLVAWDDDRYRTYTFGPDQSTFRDVREKTHTFGVGLTAAHYWELTERNSFSVRGETDLRRTEGTRDDLRISDDYTPGSAGIRFSHSLRSREEAREGDSRIEAALQYRSGRKDYYIERNHSTFASVDWVFRNAWGAVRLGVGYAW
jgi:outer membrane protein assembly factor BamA